MKLSVLTHSHSIGRGTRRIATNAFMTAAWLGFASFAIGESPQKQKPATDEQITNAVDYKLLTDAALLNCQIFGKTSNGIVTLAGTANHLLAKERAVKLTQTLRGVRGVVDTINLDIPSVPDAELQTNVLSALRYDAATSSYKIQPTVKDGVVTLSGTLHHYCEMQLTEFVVKGVKGVRDLKDNITVKVRNDRSDAQMLAEVKRIIDNDVWLDPNFIATAVKDGIVTLTGAVGSAAQHERASMVVLDAGVKSVNVEGLQIEPWAKSNGQRNETALLRGDAQILQAVKDSFMSDPRVYAFNPNVTVTNAIVTLTGVVDNLKTLRAVGQDAMNTTGVWRVMNLLKVRPAKPMADDVMSQNVSSALLLNPVVDSYDISANARRGVITLTGTVNTYFEKSEAEDIASRANGVVDVKNLLVVNSPSAVHYDTGFHPHWGYQPFFHNRLPYDHTWPYVGDREVKYDIEDAFYWSPWVVRDDITVKVENGIVTLTGKADSWFAYHKATEIAYQGGASQVFNNITLR
ncbi:MAG: hypothetical protein B7Z37_19685 [Verrucomicrobia bacterium 12-59-8]|nr:MAG: hypothetical protein B7Z37_19685 [Verrucomicrobia bacterium 12-59-8]